MPRKHTNRRDRPDYRQGVYKPINPEKNINKEPIIYRSQLEFEYMYRIDKSDNIIKWGSETLWIPYYNPSKRRTSRYFTDLYLETKNMGTLVVEIKPQKEIKAIMDNKVPKKTGNKKQSTLIYETKLFFINKSKWDAAQSYCKKRGWTFLTVSESHLRENKIPFIL